MGMEELGFFKKYISWDIVIKFIYYTQKPEHPDFKDKNYSKLFDIRTDSLEIHSYVVAKISDIKIYNM